MRFGRFRAVRRNARLGHHVQPPDIGRMFGDRTVMLRQIVDEHRDRRIILRDEIGNGLSLTALISHHAVANAMRIELRDARSMESIGQIGQDDDVRHFGNRSEGGIGVRRQRLPMHFRGKKSFEQRPDMFGFNRAAVRSPLQAMAEILNLQRQLDRMRLIQPLAERTGHMQQNFVTIRDEQRAFHDSSRSRA
jgi:hypothetical protein